VPAYFAHAFNTTCHALSQLKLDLFQSQPGIESSMHVEFEASKERYIYMCVGSTRTLCKGSCRQVSKRTVYSESHWIAYFVL
jgi:hypothetical protein